MTDTQADLVARLREQYAEQFKDEQAPEVIHNYERERFEAADELERLRASNKQMAEALRFYADERRYGGPNREPIKDDPFGLPDDPYIRDVTKDGGTLARAALKDGDKT